jgi:hypothetical protein
LGAIVTVDGAPPNAALTLLFETPEGNRTVPVAADQRGMASTELPPDDAVAAGTYRVAVRQGGADLAAATFAVLPDSVDPSASSIVADRSAITPDGTDSAEVTIRLVDRYGNPIPRRPTSLVAARADDRIDALTSQTDANGLQRFVVSTVAQGRVTLRGVDLLSGQILDDAVTIDAGPQFPAVGAPYGATWSDAFATPTREPNRFTAQLTSSDGMVARLVLTVPREMRLREEAPSVVVRAVDDSGNTVENYDGTIVFSSTDPDAILPNFGEYAFQPRDLGEKEFPHVLQFRTSGQQVLRVEDGDDATVQGEATITVAQGSSAATDGVITITAPKDGDTALGDSVTVKGNGPAFSNIVVSGGAQPVNGEANTEDGSFSVIVPLDMSKSSATLKVTDDSGRYASKPITIKIDKNAPSIGDVTFDPAIPNEGESTLVRLRSEPGLATVTATLPPVDDEEPEVLELKENAAAPGTYQAFFIAPKAGSHQVMVAVTDRAGNAGQLLVNLQVTMPSLPRVQRLEATPGANAIALSWDPVPEDVEGYRVYVGTTAESFDYTLDTGAPVTTATVAGLRADIPYYFAVTALRDGLESEEKSEVVQAQLIGLRLTVMPKDAALDLTWQFPEDAPTSMFLLEYGAEPGAYTERRMLNGSLRAWSMNDLINGVTYYLRLTPVATSGTKMEDMAAEGSGTPNGSLSGFRAGRSDPVPFNPATANLVNVPEHSKEGIPTWVMFLALGIATIVVLRRTKSRTMTVSPVVRYL